MYKKTHFHFMGIGGIGMSGIAKILTSQGHTISGCDTNHTQQSIIDLKALGCRISDQHNSLLCQESSIDSLVYSTDIAQDNPEFLQAKKRGISIIHRSLALAELMRQSYSIGVAGSHGKTTTSSLIAHVFLEAQFDPTIIIGGYLHSIQSNARAGKGKFLIAETDESDRSLLNLRPTIAVLTTIDLEHMNVYKNLHDVTTTFGTFLNQIPFYGEAIVCIDDKQIESLLPLTNIPTLTYGLSPKANWQLQDIKLKKDHCVFNLFIKKTNTLHTITLSMPGQHNALNSVGALAACTQAGIPFDQALQALSTFAGVDRRFTYRGMYKDIEIFDDYGHHPTEIACTLKNAIRRADGKPVTVIFQPHRYTRTQTLWQEFITTFIGTDIDHLIVTDLYTAGEQPIENISSDKLVEEIRKLKPTFIIDYVPYENNHASIIEYLGKNIQTSGLLLLQGAGSVTKIAQSLL